ncbi:aminopeptidase P [Sinobacterium caligoides]|uniref:Xaa-Pro aminopeptidase n=1 Tax=Sinobacterium caligoides TaxID=933926 RepID=A0A3N2DGE4_9GAMM|nr:Xaa-Pro aminopeptidase [Sinobacterium caligoides]ROR98857.1 aminopeptidase P [Sinobacterium caligoides]
MSISASEFASRRRRLMDGMSANSVAVIASAPTHRRNGDADYLYRQSSDLYYLTGFVEPESMLVLIPGRAEGECVLFCRDRDPEREQWDGKRAGQEGAVENYGADQAFSIAEVDGKLPELLENMAAVYFGLGRDQDFDARVSGWLNSVRAKSRTGILAPTQFVDVAQLIHELRLIKSPAECDIMRQAGKISAEAHTQAMRVCRPGMNEYELEAEFNYLFTKSGCKAPAYTSIVGGGNNACILHYIENDQALRDGDLVLIDAGCELEYYAADITRTFPVNGKFSPEQKALYELCLQAQLAAIDSVKAGSRWNDANEITVQVITAGLVELGLLQGEVEELIAAEAHKEFYMHGAGHWLGIDVHDVGDYRVDGVWRLLEPGMVLTIEPGIYVSADNENVEARWRGIGVRIEDDILVTDTGCEVLTASVVKTVDEIEALMARSR